jgi:hypothetical protein
VTPEAHNVPVVQGAKFRRGTVSRLLRQDVDRARQSFEFTDDAYGVSRTRKVLVNHGSTDLMAVLDTSPAALRSRWHFAPGLTVTSRADGRVVLGDGTRQVTLVQVAMPSCRPLKGQDVRRENVSPGYLKKSVSTTVISPAARSALTVIVPGTSDPTISCEGRRVSVNGVSFAM